MQGLAHIIVNGEKILVLARMSVWGRKRDCGYVTIKIRKSGKEGFLLQAESEYLSEHIDIINDLKNGKVLKL